MNSEIKVKNRPPEESSGFLFKLWVILFGAVALILFCVFALGRIGAPYILASSSSLVQEARVIALAMVCYEMDHNGNYPEGRSSTEVFQKLIDEHYISDPGVFYERLQGKTKAEPGQKLTSQNVCWDITCCVNDKTDSGDLPLVFLTGCKITYTPGGAAIPITRNYPQIALQPRTWFGWWTGQEPEPLGLPGIGVCYKNIEAKFMMFTEASAKTEASIPNFVPPTFDPKGKIYRQLTPEGSLSP